MGVFTVGRQVAIEILMPGWWLSGASLDLDFRNARYYDSSVANTVPVVTSYLSCTRASVGYAKDSSGTWNAFASNQLRVTDLGLLVEDSHTNNLVNSAAPVTQTTASLATGNYTLWVEGSGSALASAGSATITGAASATENNPDTFTVTVAGTVTVTVTGSLTRFQLEDGSSPSSFILTTGAAATRAFDNITATGNLITVLSAASRSVYADIKTNQTATSSNYMVSDNASGNCELQCAGSDTATDCFVPAGHLNASYPGGITTSGGVKVMSGWSAGGRSIVGGGGTVQTDANTFTAAARAIGSGGYSTSATNGYIRRLAVWNSRLADATLQGFTAP